MKNTEVLIKIDSLNLKGKIEEIYIYQDCTKEEYSIYYNDEIKMPLNLQKLYQRRTGKTKTFFKDIHDIKVQFNIKENLIKIIYIRR